MAIPKFLKGLQANNQRIQSVADPTSATDAATKQYVDNTAAGLNWKLSVKGMSTANLAVATALVNGLVHDGVTYATGDRILLKNQTTASENGIYVIVAAGAASRSSDADTSAEVRNMIVRAEQGTVHGDQMWQLTTDAPTLNTTSLVFTQFTGGGGVYTADGQGIEVVANQFALELDGTTLSKSATGVRIGSGAAGNGLVEATGVLAVGAGTGITVAADSVGVDTSVVARKFAADCVVTTNPQTFTHGLGTDIIVEIWESLERVFPDVTKTATSGGQVVVDWGGAPTAAQYRVVVIG